MSGFTPIVGLRPPSHVLVPPSAFILEWPGRPDDPVLVGLRPVATGTEETARAEAARHAWAMHAEPKDADLRMEAYEDALVRWVVANAACSPNDATKRYWDHAEDTVKQALTSDGVRLIYQAYERMLVEVSPLDPQLADEEVGELTALLEAGTLGNMATSQGQRARRLLRFVLGDLRLVADVHGE